MNIFEAGEEKETVAQEWTSKRETVFVPIETRNLRAGGKK